VKTMLYVRPGAPGLLVKARQSFSYSDACFGRKSLAKHVLANGYWRRLWIIQEVFLGGALKYCCTNMA
jgi:hypothetical protein